MRLEPLFEFEGAYTEDLAWLEDDAGPTAWIARAKADVKGASLNGRMRWTNEARPSHGATWSSHNTGLLEIAGGELVRVSFDGLATETATPGVFKGIFRWRFVTAIEALDWLNESFAVGETRSDERNEDRHSIAGGVYIVHNDFT